MKISVKMTVNETAVLQMSKVVSPLDARELGYTRLPPLFDGTPYEMEMARQARERRDKFIQVLADEFAASLINAFDKQAMLE